MGETVGAGCIVGLSGSIFCISPLPESPTLSHDISITKSSIKSLLFRIMFFIRLIFIERVLPYKEDASNH